MKPKKKKICKLTFKETKLLLINLKSMKQENSKYYIDVEKHFNTFEVNKNKQVTKKK